MTFVVSIEPEVVEFSSAFYVSIDFGLSCWQMFVVESTTNLKYVVMVMMMMMMVVSIVVVIPLIYA